MMFLQLFPLFGSLKGASYGPGLIADCGPLLMLTVGLTVLGVAILTATYDTRKAKRQAQEATALKTLFPTAA